VGAEQNNFLRVAFYLPGYRCAGMCLSKHANTTVSFFWWDTAS